MPPVNHIKDANLLLGEISVIVDMLQMMTGLDAIRNQSVDSDLGQRIPPHLFNGWPNVFPRKCQPLDPDFTFRIGVDALQDRLNDLLGRMPAHDHG